ncbi:MAG: membrane-bound lytic murein transglycosylase MltF [Psychrobium sp.]|nr:membrane-bound lytic murein transglycosylase MltF [Psychrobium sp.]
MIRLSAFIFTLTFLASCTPPLVTNQLDTVKQRNTLIVGTLYSPASYFSDKKSSTGMDVELAKNFAKKLGVELQVVASSDLNNLFKQLDNNTIDILTTGLSVTEARLKRMRFGPPYYQVSQQLVYKQGQKRPRKIADLIGNLTVIAGSSHHETLLALKEQHPDLVWNTTSKQDPDQLLKLLIDGSIDYTVVDSTVLARNRRIYPDISLAMTLQKNSPIAWAMSNKTDDSLFSEVISFFGQHQVDGQLAQLEEKYFGHVQRFDYVDTRAFIKAIAKKLPKYQLLFEIYCGELSWQQLAAVSYQESHWNPKARSPTGVRGMMMLTLPTEKQVGVKSRLDPEQSIKGGAIYLTTILNRLPDSIPLQQRIWFALASYNVGYGHLMDARKLAVKMAKDPDSWTDIKHILPLLEKSKYYKRTRHGFARGREAVHYVASIRRYFETLMAMDLAPRLAPQPLEIAARIDSLVQHPIEIITLPAAQGSDVQRPSPTQPLE